MSHAGDVFGPVLQALAADPTTEFGAPGARVEVLRQIDGPFSSVQRLRIQTPARTFHAYTKILRPREPGTEELSRIDHFLKREFAATSAFYNALPQDAEIGAVRPIALLPEHRALATEEVPGRPFGELLTDVSQSLERLESIASRVGGWVRVYQSVIGADGQIDLNKRRAYVDERLKLLQGRVLSASDRRDTLARFDDLCREIGVPAVPAVAIHADLTPMNIVVDQDGRVAVLDFTMAKKGTEHHDLTHVYFHLELLAARHPRRRASIEALQRAMLAGYRPGLSAADPLFRLMLLQHGVCHVAQLAERHFSIVDAAYRWFLRRRWQACVK
jgi:aminoglycoside phosphotransferase (APT) family kinase protein